MSTVKRITFDASRVDELHSAIIRLVAEWEQEANYLKREGSDTLARIIRDLSFELVAATLQFEVPR